uniref:Cysteine and histidine rich 1 n=1 Tax=Capra hircus TaxID=9925 RepID=A0A452FZ87_CAPHI
TPRPGVEPGLALGAVSLHAALRAAAGFLLQALAAAATMLASGLGTDEDCLAGAWVATVIGLPLLAFDFHWVNGDCSSASLLLGGGMMLAVAGDHLGADGRSVAGQAVVLVVAVSILIVAVFTTNSYGMWGGGVVRLEEDRLLLPKEDICRWALAGGSWAYHRALHTHTAPTVGVTAGDRGAKLLSSYHLPASDRLSSLKPAFCRLTVSLSGSV